MPKGKIPVRGYILGDANSPEKLSYEVWLETIKKYKKRGFQHNFSNSELHAFYAETIKSIDKYKGTAAKQKSKNLRVIMTYTEFKKELSKIQNAARRIVGARSYKSQMIWMGKLSEYTRTNVWSLAVKDFLHRRLNKFSYSASDIQKFFNKKIVTLGDEQNFEEIIKIISLDETGWKKTYRGKFFFEGGEDDCFTCNSTPKWKWLCRSSFSSSY
jgi:hypothetical protein